jgi:hypothetical protein
VPSPGASPTTETTWSTSKSPEPTATVGPPTTTRSH